LLTGGEQRVKGFSTWRKGKDASDGFPFSLHLHQGLGEKKKEAETHAAPEEKGKRSMGHLSNTLYQSLLEREKTRGRRGGDPASRPYHFKLNAEEGKGGKKRNEGG